MADTNAPERSTAALNKLSYGLFVLSAKEGEKDNACIINTAIQLTSKPMQISIAVNKENYTHDMVRRTGIFNVSVLSQEAPFSLFQCFGFRSGRDTDKFADFSDTARSANGLLYLTNFASALLSAQVKSSVDCGTHTLFIAEVTEARVLSDVPSVTYAYYSANIKPAREKKPEGAKKVWVCAICGYVYDESAAGVPFEQLPDDWVCPLCKHPKSDFELQA